LGSEDSCVRYTLLGRSGRLRHKGWTWLTPCKRLLWKHSQLFVRSMLIW
jgi:hypothetical protein